MIDPHTLKTLEFPKILSRIAGQCITPYGAPEVDKFMPVFNVDFIRQRQEEIAEMIDIVTVGAAFPLSRMEDVRELLDKTQVEGIFLDPEEIRLILELIEVSIDIRGYDEEGRENFPRLAEYLEQIRAFPDLRKEINRAIDERGQIKDSASSALKRIRLDLQDTRRRLIARLEGILSSQQKHPGWQDDVVTQRNGRYVIPILSGQFRNDVGIVHDRSQSGATFYVEPKETVDLNNRLQMLGQEERLEMDRILRALTAEIAMRRDSLHENIRLIALLDSYHAAARFARRTGSHKPRIAGAPGFSLVNARHPLLIDQFGDIKKVVPLTLDLGDSRQAILVTGPNTGGKTIALKTVGLLMLMAQTGLPIPADPTSEVGIFNQIYADIGDEQSIELSLSTFSSHIRNIISALGDLSEKTLVLFDEIGAGTDPKEGAALAEAIILYTIRSKARLIATTHYSQLKTLPLEHPEIENASLEFNRETLSPTYRVQIGIPGASYAVEIASRLGMPKSICHDAAELLGTSERSLSDLIANLEAELSRVKEDKKNLTDRLQKATELESFYKSQTEKLKNEVDEEKRRALAETEHFIEKTRRETEQLVAELRKSQAARQTVKKIHHHLEKAKEETRHRREAAEEKPVEPIDQTTFAKGDKVRVLSLGQVGEIEDMSDNKARIRLGALTTTQPLRNLEKIGEAGASKAPRARTGGTGVEAAEDLSPEIHLRGMTVDEAIEALEKFIDKALIGGLHQIYIIHGKGTGILRKSLTEYLKQHPEIESLRLGNWNEGGAGVTIAKLKE